MTRYVERVLNVSAIAQKDMEVLKEDLRTQRTDRFGVRNVNMFFTKDGHLFCVVESPTVDALIASNKSKGINANKEDVHEICQIMADYYETANITSKG